MKFEFNGITLRAFVIEGEPWFAGGSVAKILGYSNVSDAILKHTAESDRKKLKYRICKTSREFLSLWENKDYSDKTLINESGVYCMIFGSCLGNAEEFKYWVTRTVLPRIRQNGGYIMDEENMTPDKQRALAIQVAILSKKVENLSSANKRTSNKWHKAVAQREIFKQKMQAEKERFKKARTEYEILSKDTEDAYEILNKVLEDLENAENRLRMLKKKAQEPEVKTGNEPDTKGTTYRVDKEGRIVF